MVVVGDLSCLYTCKSKGKFSDMYLYSVWLDYVYSVVHTSIDTHTDNLLLVTHTNINTRGLSNKFTGKCLKRGF